MKQPSQAWASRPYGTGSTAILQAMLEAVERGLTTRSVLPGLGLHRKAPDVQARSLPFPRSRIDPWRNWPVTPSPHQRKTPQAAGWSRPPPRARQESYRPYAAICSGMLAWIEKLWQGAARCRGHRLSGQTERQHFRRGSGLPGRSGSRLGHGCGAACPRGRTPHSAHRECR